MAIALASDEAALERSILSRFLGLFALVGTAFTQTAATVEVWREGKMPGNGATEPEAAVPRKGDFTASPISAGPR